MHRKIWTILMLALSVSGIKAQTLTITGIVTNIKTKEPVSGAIVTIRPQGETRVLNYTTANNEGKFSIAHRPSENKRVLHVSMMGYAPQTIEIIEGKTVYNFELSAQLMDLREVTIKAPNITQQGDTITYYVSNFAEIQDQTLADVLRKMPGIEVSPTGEIKYNGVSINKFYIEGRDMLGGRYGIATNTIHQKDVSRVEVMQNHQPIRALQDLSFSENPAINIRLREDAKARWVGTVRAGAGFEPLLWRTEMAAMRFKPKTQTLNNYKSNNTGDGIAGELRRFTVESPTALFGKGYRMQNHINISPDNLREIDDFRSRFNHTHLFTTNNLIAVGQSSELTLHISYLNNALTSSTTTKTTFFLPDGTLVTEAGEEAESNHNRLSGEVTLTANNPTFYLKNKLVADVSWNNVALQATGTFPNSQEATTPSREFSNDFEILKRFGNRAYRLFSYNQYFTRPHRLTVERDNDVQRQTVQSSAFYTNTNTAVSFYISPFSVSMAFGIRGIFRTMESELTGVSDTLGRLTNNETMRHLNLFASPSIEYRKGFFHSKLDVPFSFVPYRYFDLISDSKHNAEKLFVSPRLQLNYQLTSRLSAAVFANYIQSPLREQSFHEGLILGNYRSLSQGLVDYETGNSKALTLSLRSQNALKAVFWNTSLTRSWNYQPHTSNQRFLDPYILTSFIVQPSHSNIWMASGNYSRGWDAIKGVVSISSSLSQSEGTLFQNGIESAFESIRWSVSSRIISRPTNWANLAYEVNYSQGVMKILGTDIQNKHENLFQKATATIRPSKKWYLKILGEHYYNQVTETQFKNFFLADVEFTYIVKGGLEFNISARNIFDQNVYAYITHGSLVSTAKEYVIRPRNLIASVFFRF